MHHKEGKNIIIIVFFFGELPWYCSYFLQSCSYNPSVNFLVVTDQDYTGQIPQNVRFLKRSRRQIKELADRKLACNPTIDPQPYKFCDYRPAFGVIFQEYIKDYAFWGHGDLDVIFGQIRNFVTDELLSNYDVISMRRSYISSWFTLYRNSRKVNQLYTKSNDFLKVFTTSKYFNFDETNFKFIEFFDGLPYRDIDSEVESMTHLVNKLHDESYIRAYFDLHAIERLTGDITWNKGQLIYKNEYEILLYHLKHLKTKYKPEKIPKKIPDIFHIGQSRIYH